MSNIQKTIKDLIHFYIKENYKKYLTDNNIEIIPENKITDVIDELYTEKKEHLKDFIKSSLKIMLKDNYPGDQLVTNLTLNIFSDDELCKNRLCLEIKVYQEMETNKRVDYSGL
jgi:hypothetical protein